MLLDTTERLYAEISQCLGSLSVKKGDVQWMFLLADVKKVQSSLIYS